MLELTQQQIDAQIDRAIANAKSIDLLMERFFLFP